MRPFEKIQALWAADRPAHRNSAVENEAAVKALEGRYAVRLPSDFRDYLLNACPTTDDDFFMDDNVTSWWGIGRILNVAEEYDYALTDDALKAEAKTALFFADYSLWCWAWAICCQEGPNYGRIFVVSGDDRFVADDFSAFVDQYLIEPHELL